ncbi:hypothetical protein MKW98_020633 [Papaver atlanticum]|uniref:Cupin type-1 domain-containing protein n=1 Tax=Papaver atlanticum TaxID=357466 RepID=A0AAD4TJM4_9MAGN|nr:hypothetical protein MKW98_020633 [Papaver atlanticum]
MAPAKFNIKTASSFFLVLYATMILLFALPCFSSDPDPLQDFCVADLNSTTTTVNGYPCKPESQGTSKDFIYSGLVEEASTDNPEGVGGRLGNVKSFPGINTLGISVSRIDLALGGIVPLHVHPRASEINYIVKGEVNFGFISTSNVLYSGVVKAGQMSVVPRGLVHYAKNVGGEKAVVLGILNSQLPGSVLIPSNIFASNPTIPNGVLAKNFRVDETVIANIKSNIKTATSFFLVLYSTMILFFALPCFSSDPDPLQDFCVADLSSTSTIVNGYSCKPASTVTSNDFFYSGLMNETSTANLFGFGATQGDVTTFPGLNTQGLSINRLDLAPGGIIPLHSHPRASEANFIVKGEVTFGFITTNNVVYSKLMKAGELNIIPRGLVHFAKNVGQEKAFILAILNSQLPGFSTIPLNLFGSSPAIPNDILAKNFQVNESVIASIKSKFGN